MSNAEQPTGDVIERALSLPTFRQPYLKTLRICACFPLGENPLSELMEQHKDKVESRETSFDSEQGTAWLKVRFGRRRDSEERVQAQGRVLVDCAIASFLSPSQASRSPPNSVGEVQKILELCREQKASVACCEGLFVIPQDKLPKRGFVGLMLDISASVGDAEMNLMGATFEIKGRAPYDALRWRQRPITSEDPAERQEVEVTIEAYPDDIDGIGGCLEKVADILSTGIQELVIETGK